MTLPSSTLPPPLSYITAFSPQLSEFRPRTPVGPGDMLDAYAVAGDLS